MQGDLFQYSEPEAAVTSVQKMTFLDDYRISFRLDQVLVGLIILVILYVLFFAVGVEKGKRWAQAQYQQAAFKRVLETPRFGPEAAHFKSNQSVAKPVPVALHAPVNSVIPVPEPEPVVVQNSPANERASSDGKYTVQVVTFLTRKEADSHIQKLRNGGYNGFVLPRGKYLQVCVNRFVDRQGASQLLKTLKTQGLAPKDAYIRMVPQS